mgnify:CR=1 FL=1
MAILETKKNIKEKAVKSRPAKVAVAARINKENSAPSNKLYSPLISKPRITEKSGIASQKFNAYTFEIGCDTSKTDVAKAVKEIYKMLPIKVNIINLPRKKIYSRGRSGWGKSVKKAVVYLKKDDKIDFI